MKKISFCLRLIGFGMIPSLLNFQDKYYEYENERLVTEGLVIRGYEPAFLADLVASYLLEVTYNKFKEVLWRGIYRFGFLILIFHL